MLNFSSFGCSEIFEAKLLSPGYQKYIFSLLFKLFLMPEGVHTEERQRKREKVPHNGDWTRCNCSSSNSSVHAPPPCPVHIIFNLSGPGFKPWLAMWDPATSVQSPVLLHGASPAFHLNRWKSPFYFFLVFYLLPEVYCFLRNWTHLSPREKESHSVFTC